MRQHEVKRPPGSKRPGKRLGRGNGSGKGTYSGRGMKGQKSRSGPGVRPGFEGGQLPIIRRLPSLRGFTNIFRVEYAEVNLKKLDSLDPALEITPKSLAEARVIKNLKRPLKVLGDGELTRPLVVEAHKFTQSARRKIEAAGGSVREIK